MKKIHQTGDLFDSGWPKADVTPAETAPANAVQTPDVGS
jgi:hypothetical protein